MRTIYNKVHLFGEDERKAVSAAQAAPAVVDFNGVKSSLLICYDVEFPVAVRAAVACAIGGPVAAGAGMARSSSPHTVRWLD